MKMKMLNFPLNFYFEDKLSIVRKLQKYLIQVKQTNDLQMLFSSYQYAEIIFDLMRKLIPDVANKFCDINILSNSGEDYLNFFITLDVNIFS